MKEVLGIGELEVKFVQAYICGLRSNRLLDVIDDELRCPGPQVVNQRL